MKRLLLFLAYCLAATALAISPQKSRRNQLIVYKIHTATFAGGCFWCLQPAFADLDGVILNDCRVYGRCNAQHPTYAEVCGGESWACGSGPNAAVDPARCGYAQLVNRYWRTVDYPEQWRHQWPRYAVPFGDFYPQSRTAAYCPTQ